ncbi:hypothetical protein [Craterilacuibacter sp.]|uniref:hypothetical protein n=1 Tax=Craterilacuibacter sp. TaxID=2870909 RepID=UPI003F3F2C9E
MELIANAVMLGVLMLVAALMWLVKIGFDEASVFDRMRGVRLFLAGATFPVSVYVMSAAARRRLKWPLLLACVGGMLLIAIRMRYAAP